MGDRDQALVEAMSTMEETEALEIATAMLDEGVDPLHVLRQCKQAMDIVGAKFEENVYFIPELVMAGEILEQITALAKPLIKEGQDEDEEKLGKVLIGTVHGDVHDIGKNIVTFMLDVNGFEVIDLGIDVSPQKFIDAIKESGTTVVGLSGFLTLAFDAMKDTVAAIDEAGLRDQVKIIVGGGQVNDRIRDYTGADAYGASATEAVARCKDWLGAAA
ncbi:MAG: cobalamin-dependent protein [Alphaproteobacteria bacterium]|jgi:5-methyltetrahydrofolate--homocysteine methyltransferase|nr:methionine synthase [Rhodospirillaceae bacterium]MDP6404928.1 cobalamin-dependent protein [Alphaproteobacteria bacterium]MDP6622429.1 cobalamin-dependent protein [Alphaproteobacteria bacterium]|tara:strand:- start:1114 stop:1764 length:651 start_codon:yes stop_codon:yes gene_type:complete